MVATNQTDSTTSFVLTDCCRPLWIRKNQKNVHIAVPFSPVQLGRWKRCLTFAVYLDLRFLPLVDVGLFDLEVDTFNSSRAAHDLNATEIRLKVVQHALGLVQELVQSKTAQHQKLKLVIFAFRSRSHRVRYNYSPTMWDFVMIFTFFLFYFHSLAMQRVS